MAEIRNGITEQDKLAASKRFLAALEEGEQSAREKGWIMADEVEVELKHD
jgi:hypothetical protein